MDSHIEQYKILWALLESELKRFWIGCNIFIIMETAITVSIISYLDNKNIFILLSFLIFLIIISIISIFLNLRCQLIYSQILNKISKFEKKYDNLEILTDQYLEIYKNPYAMEIANILPIFLLNISTISVYYLILQK